MDAFEEVAGQIGNLRNKIRQKLDNKVNLRKISNFQLKEVEIPNGRK
jgi:hypothetical protein